MTVEMQELNNLVQIFGNASDSLTCYINTLFILFDRLETLVFDISVVINKSLCSHSSPGTIVGGCVLLVQR